VQAVEHVAPLDHGRKQREMRELRREIEVALLARDRVQVREHLVHTAVLAIEHLLHLLAGQRGDEIVRVSGEPPQRFQRGIARCMPVRIAQPGDSRQRAGRADAGSERPQADAVDIRQVHTVLQVDRPLVSAAQFPADPAEHVQRNPVVQGVVQHPVKELRVACQHLLVMGPQLPV